jgi:hypothetical protein
MSLNLKPGTQRGLRFIGKLQKLNLTQRFPRLPGPRRLKRSNATIQGDGGYSSAAERLTVAQDVVGSIPTSRPKRLYI